MRRRVALAGLGALAAGGWHYWPEDGVTNPCLDAVSPDDPAARDLVAAAWQGLDPARVWDCHVHLLGLGDSGGGAWISPDMRRLTHPIRYARYRLYLNAACVGDHGRLDVDYVRRLLAYQSALAPGARLMLLAFDYAHDADGRPMPGESHFYVPNAYARDVARRHPGRLEWVASIHPYREDAVDALARAAREGARAVKWLPPAMHIDPASRRCDAFYAALARLGLPLLSHGGAEHAVPSPGNQQLGNPLRLRRALEHGVRVVVAHCASLGEDEDLDAGRGAPPRPSFELFARLMRDHRYEKLLYGDVSAMTQHNRVGPPLDTVLEREDWHGRLLNGSDYPLPGIFPLYSMSGMVERGYLSNQEAEVIRIIRRHNPLLFDFVLKRTIRHGGKRFSPAVFETRRHYET